MNVSDFRGGEYSTRGDYHKRLDPKWPYYPIYLSKITYVRSFLNKVDKQLKILDVGCGEGVLVDEFVSKGYAIKGLDANYFSKNIVKGDILSIPWDDNSFDIILCLDVIEHLPLFNHQKLALMEIFRVLKNHGSTIFSIPNIAHFSSRLKFLIKGEFIRTALVQKHPGDRPIKEYIKLMEEVGFFVLERKGFFPTIPFISHIIHKNHFKYFWLYNFINRFFAYPDICFTNMLIVKKKYSG